MAAKKLVQAEFDPTLFVTIYSERGDEKYYKANTSLQECDILRGQITRVAVYKLSHTMECTAQVQIAPK